MAHTALFPARTITWISTPSIGQMSTWMARAKQRRDLARLDPVQLVDLGLSDAAAQKEARKPFWRA